MIGSHLRPTDYHFQRVQSRESAELPWEGKWSWKSVWANVRELLAFVCFIAFVIAIFCMTGDLR